MELNDRLLAVLGVVPPFLVLWLAESFERRVREPTRGWRYRVLVAGGLASIPTIYIGLLLEPVLATTPEPLATLFESFVMAAGCEEVAKFSSMWLLTRGRLRPGTRYGAFLYALHAAMGFAAVENVVAMLTAEDLQAFTVRFVLRAYMAIPVHLFAGGMVGYFWARRRFDRGHIGIAGGLAMAILIHGSYDAMLRAVERLPDGYDSMTMPYAAGAAAIPLCGVVVLRVLGGRLRTLDRLQGR